ncbi:TPA: serine hydrolase domain-containing protein [Vibrio diabolicus]
MKMSETPLVIALCTAFAALPSMSALATSDLYISGITEQTTPISKAKEPLSFQEAQTIRNRFSVPNWQAAGDDGVYINMHFSSFFPVDTVLPTHPVRDLERDIKPQLSNLTYQYKDGSTSKTLDEFVHSDQSRVQAVMMAHKGKVVYEAYPGMNSNDQHIWMSTSKTTVGTVAMMLAQEGVLDLDKPITSYVAELKGTEWEKVSVRNALNMSTALDLEETTAAFSDPNSWIEKFFSSLFTPVGDTWIEKLKTVKPVEGLNPGDKFQYSTAVTQALVLAVEQATNKKWVDLFNEKVWSKVGVAGPYSVGLAANGTAVAGGFNSTTPEDMLKYAMIYTPSWNKVSDSKVISDELLKNIQTLGQPEAYQGTTEQGYSADWFGEKAERNSAQWDAVFADGAMFKHGNMHQGIYVDPARDFVAIVFATSPNDRDDHAPGYLREAAKQLSGK